MTSGLGATGVDTFCPPTVVLKLVKCDMLLIGAPIHVSASRAKARARIEDGDWGGGQKSESNKVKRSAKEW